MSRLYCCQRLTSSLIDQAETTFPQKYLKSLTHKPSREQSMAARYLVSGLAKKFGKDDFLPESDSNGIPIRTDGLCWSIAHKDDIIAAAVSDSPVGIDVEILLERDGSLFSTFSDEEWELMGEKNWPAFYRLWTAKEAVIKKFSGNLDDMPDIRCIEKTPTGLICRWKKSAYPVLCVQQSNWLLSLV